MNFLKPNFWDKKQITIFSLLLFPISLLLQFFNIIKKKFIKNQQCAIPTICVGNIYLGGTGKTPLSMKIFLILKNLNMNPAFIKKNYRLLEDETNLQKQIGSVYEDKKRIIAIKKAIKNEANVAILDDGFQDYSIKKNLSIICFNERQWIGNGLVIPSGPLRENLSALKRADCVVINGNKNSKIEKKIFRINKKMKIFYSKYKPQNIEKFTGKQIVAFSGIGNPDNFFDLLRKNNINVLKEIKFPDHHYYSQIELKNLIKIAVENNSILATTEKDYFRIDNNYKRKIDFLKISLEIENEIEFINEIKKIL